MGAGPISGSLHEGASITLTGPRPFSCDIGYHYSFLDLFFAMCSMGRSLVQVASWLQTPCWDFCEQWDFLHPLPAVNKPNEGFLP